MSATNRQLLDMVTQELRLPEIEADACVHALFDRAVCQACVDICPAQAWVLDDNALGLDTEACDGCGLCVPACPTGALHVHFPWIIRPFGGRMIALFACERSDIDREVDRLPCIHALGLRQLLLLYNSGVDYLLISTGECTDCSRATATGIDQRLEHLNELLHERNKSPIKILRRSNQVWLRIFTTNEIITRGTQLSRRAFLRGGGQQIRNQLLVLDPLNISECRTIAPGQLLPSAENDPLHWPWTPKLDQTRCNGCDACTRLCPTDALQLIHELDQDGEQHYYQLNAAHCTGCGVCTAVCDSDAITIGRWSLTSNTHRIDLIEKHCSACGSDFHLPRHNSLSAATSCRICSKHNHNGHLFQVLSES